MMFSCTEWQLQTKKLPTDAVTSTDSLGSPVGISSENSGCKEQSPLHPSSPFPRASLSSDCQSWPRCHGEWPWAHPKDKEGVSRRKWSLQYEEKATLEIDPVGGGGTASVWKWEERCQNSEAPWVWREWGKERMGFLLKSASCPGLWEAKTKFPILQAQALNLPVLQTLMRKW